MMALTVGSRLGHYDVTALVGEGGMGQVWQATDTQLNREVAIKILSEEFAADPECLAAFEKEATIVASLNHPAIVIVYSVERCEGVSFLTMELVRGQTLADRIPPGGLPPKEFFALAVPLAGGVCAAHEHGVIHGDIKPANVMVGDDGRIKILDFGLAGARLPEAPSAESEKTTVVLTAERRVAGTIPYMSPEHVQSKPLDPRSDVFSIGAVLYEMATGRRPFRAATSAAVMAAILKDTPRPVCDTNPALPRDLGRVIARCLEKEPERRLQTMLDLRNDLDAMRREPGSAAAEMTPSIAVLPFADVSVERDQDYFCEGLADEIINAIGRIEDLRVASRTSAFQFKSTSMDSREIGDRLGVRHLLEGSVRKADEQLRVSARLIDVRDGCQLWSGQFDRELRDVFAIQDQIAGGVVEGLKVTLSPRERRAIRHVATADVQAYDDYLRGRMFYFRHGRKGIESALRMFTRAIERDPTYALAYAGIADCHSFLYRNIGRSEENLQRADEASRKALDLDPASAEAHAARGAAVSLSGRHGEARASFEAAIRLDPKLFEAHYHYARECFAQGHREQALELFERAFELRPDDYQSPLLAAQTYDDLGRKEEGDAARRRGIKVAEDGLDLNPSDVRALYMAANAMVVLGDRQRGLEWARRALELDPDEPMMLYNVACVYSMAGEVEPAIEYLERSLVAGLAHREWIEHDSNLELLRDHPRFRSLINTLLAEVEIPDQ